MINDVLKFLKVNINPIIKNAFNFCGVIFSILSILLTCFTWDDVGIESKRERFIILFLICLSTMMLSFLYFILFKKRRILWENGNGKIIVSYGDILKKAFPRKNKKKKIIVIPVNTCFDTIVDEDIADVINPLISPNSIHGKWIKSLLKTGYNLSEIDSVMDKNLKNHSIKPLKTIDYNKKTRGKTVVYPIGTVLPIKAKNNITFFLLAISEFDENNNAHSSKERIIIATEKMLEFYNNTGQGYDLYVPLLGTNLANTGLSHSQTLELMTNILKIHSEKIRGKISIVIYRKDKDKVSIYN